VSLTGRRLSGFLILLLHMRVLLADQNYSLPLLGDHDDTVMSARSSPAASEPGPFTVDFSPANSLCMPLADTDWFYGRKNRKNRLGKHASLGRLCFPPSAERSICAQPSTRRRRAIIACIVVLSKRNYRHEPRRRNNALCFRCPVPTPCWLLWR